MARYFRNWNKGKQIRRILLLSAFLMLFIPLTNAEMATNIFSVEIEDNCRIDMGLLALPLGPLSQHDYVKGDVSIVRGILVNNCPKTIDNVTIALITHDESGTPSILQNLSWSMNNISEQEEVNLTGKELVTDKNLNMSMAMFNLYINEEEFYDEIWDIDFDIYPKERPLVVLTSVKRELDFSESPPLIKDIFTLNTQKNISKLRIIEKNSNYVYVKECLVGSSPCDAQVTATNETKITITFQKPINGRETVEISYYMKNFLQEEYKPESFPLTRL